MRGRVTQDAKTEEQFSAKPVSSNPLKSWIPASAGMTRGELGSVSTTGADLEQLGRTYVTKFSAKPVSRAKNNRVGPT